MFTLWYSILSYKEYKDVIFPPGSTAPSPPESIVPEPSNKPPAVKPSAAPPKTPTPAPQPPEPSKPPSAPTPLLAPVKPMRSPSPHPMIRPDVLDDIDFEDEDLLDEDEDEEDSLEAEPPKTQPFAHVSNFLQEEIRSGGATPVQKKPETPPAR